MDWRWAFSQLKGSYAFYILSSSADNANYKTKEKGFTMVLISGNFKAISEKLNSNESRAGVLIKDTTFARNMNRSVVNNKDGMGNFNENMKALKHTWPLKKYFRKQEGVKK